MLPSEEHKMLQAFIRNHYKLLYLTKELVEVYREKPDAKLKEIIQSNVMNGHRGYTLLRKRLEELPKENPWEGI